MFFNVTLATIQFLLSIHRTAQKMKLSIKDFFSKCDQILRELRIWSHLLKKSLMENFTFCAVQCIDLVKLKLARSLLVFRDSSL